MRGNILIVSIVGIGSAYLLTKKVNINNKNYSDKIENIEKKIRHDQILKEEGLLKENNESSFYNDYILDPFGAVLYTGIAAITFLGGKYIINKAIEQQRRLSQSYYIPYFSDVRKPYVYDVIPVSKNEEIKIENLNEIK